MKKIDAVAVSGIQERVANAASLASVISSAVYEGDSLMEDIGASCMVLFDYIDRTADIIDGLLERDSDSGTSGTESR